MGNGFFGWYFKCQSDKRTLAVIPAIHDAKNQESCSVQLITDSGSWNVQYPYEASEKSKDYLQIAGSRFGEEGIFLDINAPDLSVSGLLSFGKLKPLRYDIMGPFRIVPFMQCRHSVMSMRHTVNGDLIINGLPYVFRNAVGYWEGDRGRSFPKEYAWTQCLLSEGSLMLSVAEIPMAGFRFTGVIGVVCWKGMEYRLATYLGAKAVRIEDGEIVIRQGSSCLEIRLLESSAAPLQAPVAGAMERTIYESLSCKVFYRFRVGGQTLFALESHNASFEYEYPRKSRRP